MTTSPIPTEPRGYCRCPEWCNDPDDGRYHVSLQDERAVVDHDGPHYGPDILAGVVTEAVTGEVIEFDLTISDDIAAQPLTPAALRQLAAVALAAAEWFEAQHERRDHPPGSAGRGMAHHRASQTVSGFLLAGSEDAESELRGYLDR
jgi:hypothetical protein